MALGALDHLPRESDPHVAWCLREALSGGLSVRQAAKTLNVRLAFWWGLASVPEPAFAALVEHCRRYGVPDRYAVATGDVTADGVIISGMLEIIAAEYGLWPRARNGRPTHEIDLSLALALSRRSATELTGSS